MELVVTDDGSTDETPQIVRRIRPRACRFAVGFTTHPHTTFQLSRCRNEGVRASTAPYLLFLDGDCVLPPDHVRDPLASPQAGHGDGGRLLPLGRGNVAPRARPRWCAAGEFAAWAPAERTAAAAKARSLVAVLSPDSPSDQAQADRQQRRHLAGRLRAGQRLRRELQGLGLRGRRSAPPACGGRACVIESILRWTHTYHLWHPTDVTACRPMAGPTSNTACARAG